MGQCLGIAHGSEGPSAFMLASAEHCVPSQLGSVLNWFGGVRMVCWYLCWSVPLALRSFTAPQPSRATGCVGVRRLYGGRRAFQPPRC